MDQLRAGMMFLGVLFHCALPYATVTLSVVTPFQDPDASYGVSVLTLLLHLFRMPLFFIVAGFFASLLYQRYGWKGMLRNRAKRILIPLLLFWPFLFVTTILASAFTYLGGIEGILTVMDKLKQGVPLDGKKVTAASLLSEMGLLHLWFLYYLLIYYVVLVLAVSCWKQLSEVSRNVSRRIAKRLFFLPAGSFFLIGLTALLLHTMQKASPAHAGIEGSLGFVPRPQVLAAYFLFFAYGWLLFYNQSAFASIKKYTWQCLSGGALLAALYAYSILEGGFSAHPFAQSFICSGSIWMLVWGVFGFFLRFLDVKTGWGRYLTDASYWVYLVHVPFTLIVPGLLMNLPVPGALKLFLVFTLITLFCLLSYHYWVRGKFLGRLLGSQNPKPVATDWKQQAKLHSGNALLALLAQRARQFPESVGYSFPQSKEDDTWQALYQKVQLAAQQLYISGVRKGDHVVILMEGCPEMVISLYATVAIGAVATPLNTYATAAEIKNILETVRPVALITGYAPAHKVVSQLHSVFEEEKGSQSAAVPWFPKLVFMVGTTAETAAMPFVRPFSSLLAALLEITPEVAACFKDIPGNMPAFLLFTSGTTGKAKGIAITINSILGGQRKSRRRPNKLQRGPRYVFDRFAGRFTAASLLPLYHYAGLSLLFTPLTICNIKLVLLRRFHPVAALECMAASKASVLLGTPFMIQSLLTVTHAAKAALQQIKVLIFTSSAVDRNIIQRVIDGYAQLRWFLVTYGTSETGGIANSLCLLQRNQSRSMGLLLSVLKRGNYINSYMDQQEFFETPYSVGGKVAKDVSVGVRCLRTQTWLPPGAQGELWIKSSRTMKYIQEGLNQERFTEDGWFRTGDIGFVTDKQAIYITGRTSRLISRGGEKISPVEIEEVLLQFPGVMAAYVLPLPSELYGEQVGAAITVAAGIEVSIAALREFSGQLLSRFKVPEHFLILPAFPISGSGKIAEEELRFQFGNHLQQSAVYA